MDTSSQSVSVALDDLEAIGDQSAAQWPPQSNSFGMVGQESVCNMLEDLVAYAEATGSRFLDRLIVGPPGVGKSTLARSVARRLVSGGCVIFNAGDCRKPADFIDALGDHALFEERPAADADPNVVVLVPSVIFIDEAHALSRAMRAWLLSVLDDERSASCEGTTYRFTHVTFLLATTDPGKLSPALVSRCEPILLKSYGISELAAIVAIHSQDALAGHALDRDACMEIAARVQCNPRRAVRALANSLIPYAYSCLRRLGVADPAPSEISSFLVSEQIARFYDGQGVDLNGLDRQAHKVLNYLARHGTTPENRLRQAFTMTTDADFRTLDEYLLRLGLTTVTTRGRSLSEDGRVYLDAPFSLRERIDGSSD